MLLYKYVRPDGIDLVKKKRILVKNVTELNDPFELKPIIRKATKKEFQDALRKNPDFLRKYYANFSCNCSFEVYSKHIIKGFGEIICLNDALKDELERVRVDSNKYLLIASFCSADMVRGPDDVLMWSHYADSHKGFRVTIELDEAILKDHQVKIQYNDHRVEIDPLNHIYCNNMDKQFEDSLKVKSKSWEYENEFRLFIHPSECREDGGRMYYHFKPEAIVSVDVGVRTTEADTDKMRECLTPTELKNWKLRKARVHSSQFKLEYDKMR